MQGEGKALGEAPGGALLRARALEAGLVYGDLSSHTGPCAQEGFSWLSLP